MTRRLLVICTANICRSPVVEGLLARAFADNVDIEDQRWVATSAGIGAFASDVDRNTVTAASIVGIDIGRHQPRRLDPDILDLDGADLVVTMARAHLRTVVSLDPGAWSRTFTLKELARRASLCDPPSAASGFLTWRTRLAQGRRAESMLQPDDADDVADPYGLPLRDHERMVSEVVLEVDRLLMSGLWHIDLPTGDGNR